MGMTHGRCNVEKREIVWKKTEKILLTSPSFACMKVSNLTAWPSVSVYSVFNISLI